MKRIQRVVFNQIAILLFALTFSCARIDRPFDSSELTPILNQHNLSPTLPSEQKKGVIEIEEADSQLYAPIAGETIYVVSHSPTSDSEGVNPRYWLRVEDYKTSEIASKRASEYVTVGSYERLAKAYGKMDAFMLSKTSVRIWALARGKRVYALTTDSNLLTLIETPKSLRKSIESLPER